MAGRARDAEYGMEKAWGLGGRRGVSGGTLWDVLMVVRLVAHWCSGNGKGGSGARSVAAGCATWTLLFLPKYSCPSNTTRIRVCDMGLTPTLGSLNFTIFKEEKTHIC